MDKFKYNNVEYLYLCEDISKKTDIKNLKDIKEDIEMKVDFVFKCDDGMYENVVDDELYNELAAEVERRQDNGENEVLSLYQKNLKLN